MFEKFQPPLASMSFRQVRFGIIFLAMGFLLLSGPPLGSPVFAQDPEEGEIQAFLKNTGFENGSVSPWKKWPATSTGIFTSQCYQNHQAVGNCNAVLQPPSGENLRMQQAVAVTEGKWNLQVRVSTSSAGTAQLSYKMNGVVTVCETTQVVLPNWAILDCDVQVNPGTTAVTVRLAALATNPTQSVFVDDWSFTKNPYWWRQVSQNKTWTGITYRGVNAFITVPQPIIREPVHSFSTVQLKTGNVGIEAGIYRGPATLCQTKIEYSVSSDNWSPHFATVNTNGTWVYEFSIVRTGAETWRVNVWNESGILVWQSAQIVISGFDAANEMIAGGEVFSPKKQNDMGVSYLTNLRYKATQTNAWVPWDQSLEINGNGVPGVFAQPPYYLQGVDPDARNNVAVWGNNGNPVIPGSPCPN